MTQEIIEAVREIERDKGIEEGAQAWLVTSSAMPTRMTMGISHTTTSPRNSLYMGTDPLGDVRKVNLTQHIRSCPAVEHGTVPRPRAAEAAVPGETGRAGSDARVCAAIHRMKRTYITAGQGFCRASSLGRRRAAL